MSDQTELKQEEKKETQSPKTVQNVDLYQLFKQIDSLREDGVPEDVIRTAFNEFMKESVGEFRMPMKRIIKVEGMIPMPTQDQINLLYEKGLPQKPIDGHLAVLVGEVESAVLARKTKNFGFFKKFLYTAAYVLLKIPVSIAIYVAGKFRTEKTLETSIQELLQAIKQGQADQFMASIKPPEEKSSKPEIGQEKLSDYDDVSISPLSMDDED
jgi:hypothetical protein